MAVDSAEATLKMGVATLVMLSVLLAPESLAGVRSGIDEAAGGVAKETLLWYRLACFLPRVLPGEASGDAALAADYAFVLQVLGPCGRTLP